MARVSLAPSLTTSLCLCAFSVWAAPLVSSFSCPIRRTHGNINMPAATKNYPAVDHQHQQIMSSLNMIMPDLSSSDDIFSSITLARGSASMSSSFPVSEGATTIILLAGFALIVWFLSSELLFLSDKTATMMEAAKKSNKRSSAEKDFTWGDLIDYRLDYFFSTSEWANVILLLGLSYLLVVVGAALLLATDPSDYETISDAAWTSWTYVVDPGAQAEAPNALIPRTVSLVVTLGGLLVFALLIGIVGESIGDKLEDLKTGKSRVFESGHTLMLNWNDKSLAVIRQIALANESEGGGTMVVLSQMEKEEMEGRLFAEVNKEDPLRLMGTEVIFRQGNPILENDLKKVSASAARSVIALTPPDFDSDEADANMLRQVLALKALDIGGRKGSHVVVELQDVDNKELIRMVAPDSEVIVNHDMIGRLMLQCARTPELAFVLDSMLGFEGDEFYFREWPELHGKTFYEITCRFDDAIPVGFRSADGIVTINPKNDMKYKKDQEILVLAEDDDTYQTNDGSYSLAAGDYLEDNDDCRPELYDFYRRSEKILFCGWRRDMADLIMQLDEYIPAGSELWLFNTIPAKMREERLLDGGSKEDMKLKNLTIKNAVGNSIIRRDLNRIWDVDSCGEPTGDTITLVDFDSILILSDEMAMKNGEKGSTSSDSRSLASVLIIQDMMEKMYEAKKRMSSDPKSIKPPCVPVSEILDSRTKSLMSVAGCRGYVMSNEIVSSVVAQVAEEKDINVVLTELFSASGSETYIRPVEKFVDLAESDDWTFWDIALKARRQEEVAVGYKPEEMNYIEAEDLIINPPNKSSPRRWAKGDKIITFALED